MTRNRPGAHRRRPDGDGIAVHPVGTVLTLLLLTPAAAVLTSRLRNLVDLDRPGANVCEGAQALWPVLQNGLPAIALIMAVPIALLSLAHRARGWMWLAGALLLTVLVEVALGLWVSGCA